MNVLLALMGRDKGRVRYEIRWWERETGSSILVIWIPSCLCDDGSVSGRRRGVPGDVHFPLQGVCNSAFNTFTPSSVALKNEATHFFKQCCKLCIFHALLYILCMMVFPINVVPQQCDGGSQSLVIKGKALLTMDIFPSCASFYGCINICKHSLICASARAPAFVASSPPIFMCRFSPGQ